MAKRPTAADHTVGGDTENQRAVSTAPATIPAPSIPATVEPTHAGDTVTSPAPPASAPEPTPPEPTSPARKLMHPALTVTASRAMRRARRHWPAGATTVEADALTYEQCEALDQDPNFKITPA